MTWYGWAALAGALIIQIADIVTTTVVINQDGREVGFAAVFVRWGWPRWAWMGFPKAIAIGFATWAYFRSGENAPLGVLAVLSAWTLFAVWHNWGQIRADK